MATILITGASSGLGEEMARTYASRGNNLALCARRLDRLEALREELQREHPGVDVQVAALDVNDAGAVEKVFTDFAQHFGGLEIVIANAGIGNGGPIGMGAAAENRHVIETNVVGMINQIEPAVKMFRERGRGQLVMVSSFAAVRGMRKSMTAYSASKAAVAALAEGLRIENVPGLTVTTIYPGYIATEMTGSGRKKPFMVDTKTGVAATVQAIDARKKKAFVPWWPWAVLAKVFPILPASVARMMT